MLLKHPLVAFARSNVVGSARLAKGGWVTFGIKGDLDIYGMMNDGRYFEIEIKVEGMERNHLERIKEQQERVIYIRNNCGLAGFAMSVEEAFQIIEEKR